MHIQEWLTNIGPFNQFLYFSNFKQWYKDYIIFIISLFG